MAKSNSEKVKDWRIRTKHRIVEALGGCCSICEYDTYHGALELHHLDPNKKKFGLSSVRANPKSWKRIVNELRKCVLVCSNCHKEIEAGLIEIEVKQYFNEDYSTLDYFKRERVGQYKPKQCITCDDEFEPSQPKQKKCFNCIIPQ